MDSSARACKLLRGMEADKIEWAEFTQSDAQQYHQACAELLAELDVD
jgi:hypothetical protein